MRLGMYRASWSTLAVAPLLLVGLLGVAKADPAAANLEQPHRVSVLPLDLERVPTDAELSASGQLGGALHPVEPVETTNEAEVEQSQTAGVARTPQARRSRVAQQSGRASDRNRSFGAAIQRWNAHEWDEAIGLFKRHLTEHPDSPWAAEAEIHLACEARYQGRYTEAEQRLSGLLERLEDRDDAGARRLANKARLRLGEMKTLRNNPADAAGYFADLSANGLDWRERTYASHWVRRLAAQRGQELALLNCGYLALAELLDLRGEAVGAADVRGRHADSTEGQSLAELTALADGFGLSLSARRLAVADLDQLPLPAIVHIQANADGDQGHYWLLQRKRGEILTLFDPQSGRTFRQSEAEFAGEWQGVALLFAADPATLPGVELSETERAELTGGCCGAPRPEDDLGDPNNDPEDDTGEEPPKDPCDKGECFWRVNPLSMNLYVTDQPLWYDPPIGPKVGIKLSYNSQSALAQHEPFGNKWQFNYGSYLVVDPGDTVTVFMPDGRRDLYNGDTQGNYTAPVGVYNRLTNLGGQRWELRFPDDSAFIYDIPAGTSSMQPFLVEARDRHGEALTFAYNAAVQLTAITDAVGQVTTFAYNADGLVETVTDPFGRSASFEYDAAGNLTQITDMAGYWSRLTYDANVYLTSIEKADGTWQFWIEPATQQAANSDNYPPPGDTMWANYRITITDPHGGKEEWFYYGGCDEYGCSGYTWNVSPRHYIPWSSQQVNNFRSNPPKTRYIPDRYSGRVGQIARIEYPEQGQQSYQYDSAGNVTRITKPDGGIVQLTYNNKGKVTSITEPNGKVTNMVYAANGVDLLSVTDSRGTLAYQYNAVHQVTRITDRRGTSTELSYNNFGQVTQITAAAGTAIATVTRFIYGTDHRLQRIEKAGATIAQYTYDAVGRVRTETDASGLTLTYDYDDLNQVTRITYPDGGSETFTWSDRRPFQLAQQTARGGRVDRYGYDPEKRLTQSIAPDGGLTRQQYDADGNLTALIDANSNATSYSYDADGLVTAETYADGKGTTYAYDTSGRVRTRTNARGIQTVYSYDLNGNLTGIDYSDATPDVTFIYDAHGRLIQRNDGIGTTRFTYDANDNLLTVDGPWADDTITYTYDPLDRRTGMDAQGGTPVTYGYDALGRLASVTHGSRAYTLAYQGNSNLIDRLTRPNGSYTTYTNDALQRLTALGNYKSDDSVINRFQYSYDTDDQRAAETVTNGLPTVALDPGLEAMQVNALNQVTSATNPARTYQYDADGNMTRGYTPAGYVWTASFDGEDRLARIEYTDAGGVLHRTEFAYLGNDLVGRIRKYDAGVLTSETHQVRDGFLAVQERDGSNAVGREYLWRDSGLGGIGRLLQLKNDQGLFDYLGDGRGNVVGLTNSAQTVVAGYRYGAYGATLSATGTLSQPMRFSSKSVLDDFGVSDFGYRFFDSSAIRWINRDPLGAAAGSNLYLFVDANPIDGVDSLGLQSTSSRSLTECEIAVLSPYFERALLDKINVSENGHVPPGYDGFSPPSWNNTVYLRRGAYDSMTTEGIGLLGHEVKHQEQWKHGGSQLGYAAQGITRGYSEISYEKDADAIQARIVRDLRQSGFSGCVPPPPPNCAPRYHHND